MKLAGYLLLLLFVSSCSSVTEKQPQISFAREKIQMALDSRAQNAEIEFQIDETLDLKAEGFIISKEDGKIIIAGKDAAGAMYGGLDVAETIFSEGVENIKEKSQNPYKQMRGVKFNIPLDVRTPSYSDVCDAAQKNIPEMWSMEFWHEFIDKMAEFRYNYISLWSMHPFPSLVKVPEYPEIALDDVKRSKGPFKEFYHLRGIDWDGSEFEEDNLETLKKMTIDEKIDFWREVMAYGKSRNVDFYIVTWNIFVYGTDGKYGITNDPQNETTMDYFRQSVKALILTYPELAGIGITTGENMVDRSTGEEIRIDPEARENWMVKTYVAGTLDALKADPDRKIRFIHRQHLTGADMVLGKMEELVNHPNVDFIFSFKYAKAHVYSATKQPYHEEFVDAIRGKVKTIWTLRNDDVYLFRWGAPDFIREFVKNIPTDVSQGYYYGHDGFIMGREFTQLEGENPRQLEIEKHWLRYMLWGRFGYNPDYSNDRIIALLNTRYPELDGATLFDAWQKASMVYPRVTGFHWGALDFQWYIEGVKSAPHHAKWKKARSENGFNDVETFLTTPSHEYSGVQRINHFVDKIETEDMSPLELADLIDKEVDEAEKTVNEFGAVENKELRLILDDIKIICEMGRYYADKIRGSTYVALGRKTMKKSDKKNAIDYLNQAVEHYQTYVQRINANHLGEVWFNRVGRINFEKQTEEVIADLEFAEELKIK